MTGGRRFDGDGGPPPVIIRRPRRRPKWSHGHGAWKVAYADFVTSMMALFIVLWAVQQNPEVRASIANYFRNAQSASPSNGDLGLLPSGTGVVSVAHAAPPPADDDRQLKEAAERFRAAMEADPDLSALRDQVRIEMTVEGLRIQFVEKDDSLLFEIGSAQVKPALTRLLGTVASIVGPLPNEVTVEGHTDTRQYGEHRRGYSNWELSSDRANSARRVLDSAGLRPRQITRVVGFADHELLMADNPLDAQNRRVSVIVRRATVAPPALPPRTAAARVSTRPPADGAEQALRYTTATAISVGPPAAQAAPTLRYSHTRP